MPKPPRPKTDAAESLVALAPLATRWIERLLAAASPPLSVSQFLALRAIAREEISAAELARRAGVSAPAVSQLLSGLLEAGLIERLEVAEDRRRLVLALSAAGEEAFLGAKEASRRQLGALLEDLPRPEQDALARSLPVLEALLSGQAPPARRPPPPKPKPKPGPGKPGPPDGRRGPWPHR